MSILSSASRTRPLRRLWRSSAPISASGETGAGVWILNAIILIFLFCWAPNFFNAGNIHAVLNDASILGIGAAGMTILIMAGAFDLSVTAIMGLAPIVALLPAGNLAGPTDRAYLGTYWRSARGDQWSYNYSRDMSRRSWQRSGLFLRLGRLEL